jgi:hypothetical protein
MTIVTAPENKSSVSGELSGGELFQTDPPAMQSEMARTNAISDAKRSVPLQLLASVPID